MRSTALTLGLLLGLSAGVLHISGCAAADDSRTLSNDAALKQALQISSITEGDQPFHLLLEISPPTAAERSLSSLSTQASPLTGHLPARLKPRLGLPSSYNIGTMRAQVEFFWLNHITYRVVIRSATFNQTRIVNGNVTEEHDTGDFYPRWIQNFVDAMLDPVPHASQLLQVSGSVPVGSTANACFSSADSSRPVETSALTAVAHAETVSNSDSSPGTAGTYNTEDVARVCFRGGEPRLASGMSFSRYVAFDDYRPFGQQQIPRTLINVLPASTMVNGRVILLEPLPQADYPLLKAYKFTPPAQQIQTASVSETTAETLLLTSPGPTYQSPTARAFTHPALPDTIYIRTDRTGQVREAYRNAADHFHQQDRTVARALTLRFKPLVVNGVPMQMEAPFRMP